MSSTTLTRPDEAAAPPPTTRRTDPVRTSKILALVAIAVPTALIFAVMTGVVEFVRAVDGFPYVDISFSTPALFSANTPTGGDMGAHVYLPQFLQDTLLPDGRLFGWSNDWYAGFPALYFYFPLPALTTVLLNVFLPYGVAFKLTTIIGLLALPAAVYVFIRCLGFARVVAGLAAAFGATYVFMESFSIFGGNIKSTLAGEFSFGWSFAFSLVYLGLVAKDTREGRGFTPRAGIVLALTAFSHVVTTMVVVVVSLPLLFRRNGAKTLLRAWGVGFAVAAVWALPLGIRLLQGMTSDMNWSPVRGMLGDGSTPGTVATPMPNEFIPIVALGVIGLVWSLVRRNDVLVLISMTTLPLLGYWVLQLPDAEWTTLYNARLLPYWYLGVFIFAGLAVGLSVRALARYVPDRTRNVSFGVGMALIVILNVTLAGVHDVPGWVRWNYTGYEGKDAFGEYIGLMETVDQLPPGRIMWEPHSPDMGKFGTPMALMLLPYWSEGHPSMEGLFFESSLTTHFHFLNAAEVAQRPSNPVRGLNYRNLDMARGIEHLQLYNVDYYLAWTPEGANAAREQGLEEIGISEPWVIFRLPDSSLVDIASVMPSVYVGDEDFHDASLLWYDDYLNLDNWMVEEGPESWPRVTDVSSRLDDPAGYDTSTAFVTDVQLDHDRISFRTSAVGVPHLVKVSYFPAWQASGAEGPFRAAPSLMVVVPTQEEVVIEFVNGVPENAGLALTGFAVFALAGWGLLRRRRSRTVDA
ncbi:MAG TPA: hypothetical protein VLG28_05910 [Acidimicrobiia bacterium]|nr:hypothetical protein [Acidimicrobiia bacterium]